MVEAPEVPPRRWHEVFDLWTRIDDQLAVLITQMRELIGVLRPALPPGVPPIPPGVPEKLDRLIIVSEWLRRSFPILNIDTPVYKVMPEVSINPGASYTWTYEVPEDKVFHLLYDAQTYNPDSVYEFFYDDYLEEVSTDHHQSPASNQILYYPPKKVFKRVQVRVTNNAAVAQSYHVRWAGFLRPRPLVEAPKVE